MVKGTSGSVIGVGGFQAAGVRVSLDSVVGAVGPLLEVVLEIVGRYGGIGVVRSADDAAGEESSVGASLVEGDDFGGCAAGGRVARGSDHRFVDLFEEPALDVGQFVVGSVFEDGLAGDGEDAGDVAAVVVGVVGGFGVGGIRCVGVGEVDGVFVVVPVGGLAAEWVGVGFDEPDGVVGPGFGGERLGLEELFALFEQSVEGVGVLGFVGAAVGDGRCCGLVVFLEIGCGDGDAGGEVGCCGIDGVDDGGSVGSGAQLDFG